MDYGRLTDHMGKRIDFTNVILIMTSNVGANEIVKEKGLLGVTLLQMIMKKKLIVFLVQNLEIG